MRELFVAVRSGEALDLGDSLSALRRGRPESKHHAIPERVRTYTVYQSVMVALKWANRELTLRTD